MWRTIAALLLLQRAFAGGGAELRAPSAAHEGRRPDSMRVEILIPPEVRAGQPVRMTLVATNITDRPITLFLQGRPIAFDVIVRRNPDEVVWRRLENATVSAVLQLRTLGPGEMLELNDTWRQISDSGRTVGPGEYTVTGELLTDRAPLRTGPAHLRIKA
jgi:intracellular proteinase inhibitor BsuPI